MVTVKLLFVAFVVLTSKVEITVEEMLDQETMMSRWLYQDLNLTMVNADGGIITKLVTAEDAEQNEACLEEYTDTLTSGSRQSGDRLMTLYANCTITHLFKMNLKWISIDSTRDSLRRRKYRRLAPTLKMSSVTYSTIATEAPKPKTMVTKWIHNFFATQPIDSIIKESVSEEESTAISTKVAWEVSATAKASLKVGPAEASTEISVGGRGEDTDTKEVINVKAYSLEDTVSVAPNSSAKVVWTMFEQNLDVTWSAYMIFTGNIAVGLDVDGEEEIWFLPLSDIAKFVAGFLEREEEPGALYVPIEGQIQGNRGVQSITRCYEMPLIKFDDDESMVGKCEADLADNLEYDEVLET